MNQELKAKWLAALRGGEFKQLSPGGSDWTRKGMHCCIGVLGELLGEQQAMAEHVLLSRLERADIPSQQRDTLIDMNDGKNGHRKHSFAEIADYIEANL